MLTACGKQEVPEQSHVEVIIIEPPIVVIESESTTISEPLWTEQEVQAIALTLAGECYDDKEWDKRRVCEVILNRVSEQALADWYANGCKALSDYLYFCAGENRENVFRSKY